jgi:hypothetical protein
MAGSLDITVTLAVKTCDCGMCYAVPHWVADSMCPMCAKRRHIKLQQELSSKYNECDVLARTISSLRGALTKAKRVK